MRTTLLLAFALLVLAPLHSAPPDSGAVATGRYRNLFKEYLGKTDAEITARLDAAARQLFAGDPNSERLYYEVPGGMAYVPDINNHDVRSEGLSYGMMIAVQMNRRAEFDRLWKFARHYMHHESGPFRGYFAWHTAFDGRRLSNGPAPDGEAWFVTALFFAAHRWGNGAQGESAGGDGLFNYSAEAQAILRDMIHAHAQPGRGPVGAMFHPEAKQIVFVPTPPGNGFTDPSYHVPAFTELWARWAADAGDRAFLAEVTRTSRELFCRAAHPRTGLMPDYSNFDGTPRPGPHGGGHEHFQYDAWRTLSNPALDWSWWRADPWQVEQSNRVLRFLAAHGENIPDLFRLDGTSLVADSFNAPGLIAMAATAALAADRKVGEPWVRKLWELPLPRGRYRYYNGLLTMLALLQVSGNFRAYGPPAP